MHSTIILLQPIICIYNYFINLITNIQILQCLSVIYTVLDI